MNDGELNGLVAASVCLILYFGIRFVMGWWKWEKKSMDDFSAAMEMYGLQRRTEAAEQIAKATTPDRVYTQQDYNRAMNRMIDRAFEAQRAQIVAKEIREMVGEE